MIQIREMQVRDTNAVAEIERQIFSQPWSRQGFLDAVNLGNTVFLVAEENNRIIGYIGMYLPTTSIRIPSLSPSDSAMFSARTARLSRFSRIR